MTPFRVSRQPWFGPTLALVLVTLAYVPGGTTYLLSYLAVWFFPSLWLMLGASHFGDILTWTGLTAFVVSCECPAFLAIVLGVKYLRGVGPYGDGVEPTPENRSLPKNIARVAIVLGILHVALFLLCMFTSFDVLAVL